MIYRVEPPFALRILRHQLFQGTSQCLPDADDCPEQHINFSRFNSLNVSDIQVGHLREPLLTQILRNTLATNVVA